MFKKSGLALLASLFATSVFAANIPAYLAPPWDPTNGQGSIGNLIQSLNANISGMMGSLTTPFTSSGVALQTAATFNLAGNALKAGQVFQVHAFGVNSADANAKTVTFAFGAATCAVIVTGSGNFWTADFTVVPTAAAAETTECHGMTNVTNVTSTQSTSPTVSLSAPVIVLVEVTPAVGGTMTVNGAWAYELN